MAEGYIYVLTNPGMVGLVKVGKTSRSPELRAAELSQATGVAQPFLLIYSRGFKDMDAAERQAHVALGILGKRVSRGREFFEILPHKAVQIVTQIEDTLSSDVCDTSASSHHLFQTPSLASVLYEEGLHHLNGSDPMITYDEKRGIELLERAGTLGFLAAYRHLAHHFECEYLVGAKQRIFEKAKYYVEKQLDENSPTSLAFTFNFWRRHGEAHNTKLFAALYLEAAINMPTDRCLIEEAGFERGIVDVIDQFGLIRGLSFWKKLSLPIEIDELLRQIAARDKDQIRMALNLFADFSLVSRQRKLHMRLVIRYAEALLI
jgi:T5orf172 domain